MTEQEKIEYLIECTGETNQTVLATYLKLAKGIVLRKAFPFGDGTETMPAKYDTVHAQIAAYLLNKRGSEGELSHSEGNISRDYGDADLPISLIRQIVPQGVVL